MCARNEIVGRLLQLAEEVAEGEEEEGEEEGKGGGGGGAVGAEVCASAAQCPTFSSIFFRGRKSQRWRGKSSTKSFVRRVSSCRSDFVNEMWMQSVNRCHASVCINSEFWTTIGLVAPPTSRGLDGISATKPRRLSRSL